MLDTPTVPLSSINKEIFACQWQVRSKLGQFLPGAEISGENCAGRFTCWSMIGRKDQPIAECLNDILTSFPYDSCQ